MNQDPEIPDPGEPLEILAAQEIEATAHFLPRLRRKIHRRVAVSQVASFSWHLPCTVLLEMARMLGHVAHSIEGKKDGKS